MFAKSTSFIDPHVPRLQSNIRFLFFCIEQTRGLQHRMFSHVEKFVRWRDSLVLVQRPDPITGQGNEAVSEYKITKDIGRYASDSASSTTHQHS